MNDVDVITELKLKIAEAIEAKLKEDPSSEDLLNLARAAVELERNDAFKVMASNFCLSNKTDEPAAAIDESL